MENKSVRFRTFSRQVLGEFMTENQLLELDKTYAQMKEVRKARRFQWRKCPCCGRGNHEGANLKICP